MSETAIPQERRQASRPGFDYIFENYTSVIYAIIMHDIKNRFFGSGLGQIVMILWPFVHILVLLALYTFSGRPTPYGESLVLYSCTGIIPFIIFSYMSRWIVLSAMTNRSFLNYPIIKPLDLLIARAILEVVNTTMVSILVLLMLVVMGVDPWPNDALQAFAAYGACMFLAFGMGILNGVITTILPLWNIAYTLLIIVSYAASGILFVPSELPEKARYFLSFNPLLQGVEWMRSAFYSDYTTSVLDKGYLLRFGLVSLFIGLVIEKPLRRFAQS